MAYLTENMLVKDFKKTFRSSLGSNLALTEDFKILEEIKTNWGIVDILVIKYDTKKLERRRRLIKNKVASLSNISIYAIAHIIENPYLTIENLGKHLKIKNGLLLKVIKNLTDRDLINCFNNGGLRAKPYKDNYVIKEILAFEAKLNNWKKAVIQSERHLWFTNSSFVILPELSKTVLSRVQEACNEKGIGLIVQVGERNFQIQKKPLYKKHIDSIIYWKINEALVDGSKFNGSNPLR